jgi:hypothetical protein
MDQRSVLARGIPLALLFIFILAIPIYIITKAYINRETFTYTGRVFGQQSNTVSNNFIFEPTSTLTPQPSVTPTPTSTLTPTSTISPTFIVSPGFDFSGAYVIEVIHFDEDGPQSIVKIKVPRVIVGEFFAEVRILWTEWDFTCILLEESEDHLFCVGPRLPPSNRASIRIYEVLSSGQTPVLVLESEFVVLEYVPSTSTPSKPKSPPGFTPTPSITPTPTITPLPTQTYTPVPPTSTLPPWATPPTPGG